MKNIGLISIISIIFSSTAMAEMTFSDDFSDETKKEAGNNILK